MTKGNTVTGSQRVLVTHSAYDDEQEFLNPIAIHSEYRHVGSATFVGTNVLRLEHKNGDVSMVALGEGFTVSFSEDEE